MLKRKARKKTKQVAILLTVICAFLIFIISQLQDFSSAYVVSPSKASKIPTQKVTIHYELHKKLENEKLSENITKPGLTCEQLQELLKKARSTIESEIREENDVGNRGIYSSSLVDDNGQLVDVILKVATLPEFLPLDMHYYRYKTALKEIENIEKLEKLGWKGIPKLYGACVQKQEVVYAVARVLGQPLCSGMGTNVSCGVIKDLTEAFSDMSDPGFYTLLFASKVSCFFQQFERDRIFMEDLSGSNLFYSEKTFDIFVVDADSLIFYGDNPINSGSSCKNHKECPGLSGNFWITTSLNRLIYPTCLETKGNCVDYVCRGIDASLHACGVGRWLLSGVRNTVPKSCMTAYREVVRCLTKPYPEERCTFETACEKLQAELASYQESLAVPIEIE